jgi:hypothetical protein
MSALEGEAEIFASLAPCRGCPLGDIGDLGREAGLVPTCVSDLTRAAPQAMFLARGGRAGHRRRCARIHTRHLLTTNSMKNILPYIILWSVIGTNVLFALLFIPAGTLNYWQGWAYAAVVMAKCHTKQV